VTRIEEIRKRLEDSKHVYFSASEEEVSYLLSQLDIAVKALENISVPMPGSRDNQLVLYYERTAKEALEKLRG